MEKSDPHSSVTYINLASTGATIKEGILGTQNYSQRVNCEPEPEPYADFSLPSQISQLQEIAAGRTIDHITISVGGNDIGFSTILRALVLRDPHLYPLSIRFGFMKECVKNGSWGDFSDRIETKLSQFLSIFAPIPVPVFQFFHIEKIQLNQVEGMDKLSGLYRRLGRELSPFIKQNHTQVYMMEYPNPLYDTQGNLACNQILGQIQEPLEIGQREMKWAVRTVINPLNREIKSFCNRRENSNWHYIKDVSLLFRGHAICEREVEHNNSTLSFPQPIDLSNNYRWIRARNESCRIIGDEYGAVHPNDYGHFAIKNQLMKVWTQPFDQERLEIAKKDSNLTFFDLIHYNRSTFEINNGVSGSVGSKYSLNYISNFPDLVRFPEYKIGLSVKVLKDV